MEETTTRAAEPNAATAQQLKLQIKKEWALHLPNWLALLWLVSKAQWFWRTRPDLQFGWVVLGLCFFLFLEAWDRRPPLAPRPNPLSYVFTAAGLGLLFLMQAYQAALGMNPAMLMGVAFGTMLVIAGNLLYTYSWPGLKRFAFAFAFILIALPMPSFLHGPIVNGLQNFVSASATELLNLWGVPAMRSGSLIELPVGTVGVAEACSGIRSLQSTLMATLFISYLTISSMSLRIMLIVLGIILAIVGNLGRTLILCSIALHRGIESVSEVHDAAGWSILAFATAGVVVAAWLIKRIERRLC